MAAATLPESVRLLAFFAGYGAATVEFGISSTVLAGGPAPASTAGAALIGLWAASLALWATLSLRAGRVRFGRSIAGLLAAAAAAHLAAVVAEAWFAPAGQRGLDISNLCAFALSLLVLGSLGWLRSHRQTARPAAAAAPPAGRLLGALFAAAVIVASVTTPGLAASAAGHVAVPHGAHGSHLQDPAQHHGH
ncbi:hypothetical protein KIH31_08585 [Paenarthrobacter sp. DKR-5]|uniref:hypothetical protein n=1 Tax=Paenarthrobacter sp. DKR-5 TaxID=2835535 RepID=UPI001BDD72BA|nr:hypothetical protein [Paenarthrobacter sp. DKR-5]MBT1002658.1 hypothetical protein [Paenarthrobacter sp. DKR-5]